MIIFEKPGPCLLARRWRGALKLELVLIRCESVGVGNTATALTKLEGNLMASLARVAPWKTRLGCASQEMVTAFRSQQRYGADE